MSFSPIFLISAIVADGLSGGIQNQSITATITDDQMMASIQQEAFSFELEDHF
jgi:hypothetical protein